MHIHDQSRTANIPLGHFTDEELDTFDRLLKKAGVPENLLRAARREPIDFAGQAAPMNDATDE